MEGGGDPWANERVAHLPHHEGIICPTPLGSEMDGRVLKELGFRGNTYSNYLPIDTTDVRFIGAYLMKHLEYGARGTRLPEMG